MNFLYTEFKLDHQNHKCDFLNINLDEDTRLFVDAYAMSRSSNQHMLSGHETLKTLMSEKLVEQKKNNKYTISINKL